MSTQYTIYLQRDTGDYVEIEEFDWKCPLSDHMRTKYGGDIINQMHAVEIEVEDINILIGTEYHSKAQRLIEIIEYCSPLLPDHKFIYMEV